MGELGLFAITATAGLIALFAIAYRRRTPQRPSRAPAFPAAAARTRSVSGDTEQAARPATMARQSIMPPPAALVDNVAGAVVLHREHVLYANPAAATLRGMRQQDLIGQTAVSLFVPDDRGQAADMHRRRLRGDETPPSYSLHMLNRAGEAVPVLCTDTLVEHDGAPALLTTAFDIGHVVKASMVFAAAGQRALATLGSMGDGVVNADSDGRLVFINPAARVLMGLNESTEEAWQGKRLTDLVSLVDEADRKPLSDPIARSLDEGRAVNLGRPALLITAAGEEHAIELRVSPLLAKDGDCQGVVAVLHDVTELRGIARQMSYQASHDALTGLLNRREFERRLSDALVTAPEAVPGHVLCYLDLDRFKAVNDTCGHVAGDHLLRQLAALIREKVRDSDSVARLGGDEFGLLLSGCPLDKARQIADDVCNGVEAHRFVWRDKIFQVSVSIGLVEIGGHSGSVEDALSAADSACYVAKQRGRSRVHVYSSKDEAQARHSGEIAWLQLLQNALKDDQFSLVAQPIVAAASSERGGPACEVLLRLRDRQGVEVSPSAFGESAARYQLMPRIDRWVLRRTLSAIESGALSLPPGRRCTLNLSGQTMGDPGFLEFVVDCFDELGVGGEQLCFEVTESAVITNLTHARRFIDVLHGLNCHFALDDFGSGMGSFANLKNLHMDYIKIDGSFTRNLGEDAVNQAMVGAMVKLARSLGIRVVAEQVESQSSLDAVRRMGIDFVQGHVIGEPAPVRR
ncbi:MAG: EAL domain-containing protein [Gammaproteobacteria bacterium]